VVGSCKHEKLSGSVRVAKVYQYKTASFSKILRYVVINTDTSNYSYYY